MSSELRFRRGSTSANNAFTGAQGEVAFDTDTNTLVTHNGAKVGGYRGGGYKSSMTGAVARAVEDKLNDAPCGNDVGVATGNADNLTQLNTLFSAPRRVVDMADGDYVASTDPTNKYGVRVQGNAKVKKPITGGYQQLNLYADQNKYAIGREYLYAVYASLIAGTSTINSFVYGDSTVTDGYSPAPYYLSTMIPGLLIKKGISAGKFVVTNRGVGGTKITDMNAIPDLGAGTKLIFIKYGINDGANAVGTRLDTFADNLRSQLASIRANANGSISSLAIVLVGPNSTSDTPNGRDEYWYEQLRGIYEKAARDYKCAYYDTYASLNDSRGAAGLWMDNPYADGRAIHPAEAMQPRIWGDLIDWMFGSSETFNWRRNHLTNTGSLIELPLASAVPSSYDYGITIKRGTAGNGWPIDGQVTTIRQVDNSILQIINGYGTTVTQVAMRQGNANPGFDVWAQWTGQPNALTLSNGWVNHSGWEPARVMKTAEGLVSVSGLIDPGTTTSGTLLTTLPAGYRPENNEMFVVSTSGSGAANTAATLMIAPTGAVTIFSTFTGSYISLSNIKFRAYN